jgi:hypothetical protein
MVMLQAVNDRLFWNHVLFKAALDTLRDPRLLAAGENLSKIAKVLQAEHRARHILKEGARILVRAENAMPNDIKELLSERPEWFTVEALSSGLDEKILKGSKDKVVKAIAFISDNAGQCKGIRSRLRKAATTLCDNDVDAQRLIDKEYAEAKGLHFRDMRSVDAKV